MAKYEWKKKGKNTVNRHKDDVYKITDVNGSVRLIKDTGKNFFEIDPNNGSEIREIAGDEASRLIPNNANPLTFEQKTELLGNFDANFDASASTGSGDNNITITGGRGKTDMFPGMGGAGFGGSTPDKTYFDPDQTGLEELANETAMNKRLAPAYARGARQRATNELNPNEYDIVGKELDPKYAGESISMAEFKTQQAVDAGRRPIADNAPIYLSPDPNKLNNLEQTNISLPPSINESAGTIGVGPRNQYYKEGSVDFQQHTGGQTDFSSLDAAMAPGLDQKNLQIGTGGDPGLFEVDDDFYRTKDGTLMKDAGWWGDDTVATQADIDAGITDQNSSSPWGTTEGWKAAGSVATGLGGLASAYTGIKNYQLARDAHNTQKNQWQQNYDQRLKAYGDNLKLMNEEIRRKNRTLEARWQKASYQEI